MAEKARWHLIKTLCLLGLPAEMAAAAQARGYEYLAISDHSPRLRVAGGVSPEDLKKKKKEIDALNAKNKSFRILLGSEVEIDMDGNLDYNDIK